VGSGEGQNWAEAGGSSAAELAELFLQSSSSLAPGGSVGLGGVYNRQVNGEDLVLSYRLPDGRLEVGLVEYMGEVTAGIMGDYNGNLTVEQADLDLVLLNWGQSGVPGGWINDLPEGNIDQAELDGVLLNWGNMAGRSLATGNVPEPGTLLLLLLAVTAIAARRR
jgi:hypothetical protein